MANRFIVGIDLGTTNCALSWVDLEEGDGSRVRLQPIPQLVNPGEVAARTLLPSFLYSPGPMDFPAGSTALPWAPDSKKSAPQFVAGELARRRGAESPVRLVASAKSWLSYGGANRTAPILPWGAPEDVAGISPVDASAEYLRHLAAAFDSEIAKGDKSLVLSKQDILLTVPASFDEEARELTLRAAQSAGLPNVTLLEEPQAAFYAWLDALGDQWRRRVKVGDLVLVCDVGGGTTDFSLIAVGESDGDLTLERVAVGEHILLGGDNMDLALARFAERQFGQLDALQFHSLWQQARAAKEALLANDAPASHAINILGRGTGLVGGTRRGKIARDEVRQILLEGFFPIVDFAATPERSRRAALMEVGLNYANDPAVTRHLAQFLRRAGSARPTHLLLNGGVLQAAAIEQRLFDVLNGWLAESGAPPVVELRSETKQADLMHAVAHGAAYYGLARAGKGVRIRGGVPRAYYVGIESSLPAVPGLPAPMKAFAVVPFGLEEGSKVELPQRKFALLVGEPAEFRFFSSLTRKTDPPGSMLEEIPDDLEELSPIEVFLPPHGDESREEVVPVTLESNVTETGMLELWCVAADGRRWKLEFNVRERAQAVA